MRLCEITLNEIGFASGISGVNLNISNANLIGDIDTQQVFLFTSPMHEFYMFEKAGKITAYLAITIQEYDGYHRIERIHNISAPHGAITALCVFVISKLGYKLILDKNEDVTNNGLQWITKLVKSGGRGLNIHDQNNNPIDISALNKEWNIAYSTKSSGPTSIIIENKNIIKKPLYESKYRGDGILLPYMYWLFDKDID